MSNSTDPEKNETTDVASIRPLPDECLNALDDLVNEKIPCIIYKMLAEGEEMLVFRAPKVGKSQFAPPQPLTNHGMPNHETALPLGPNRRHLRGNCTRNRPEALPTPPPLWRLGQPL